MERTVKEVTPALTTNSDKLAKLIETLEKQLREKGEEVNGHMEKHNIQVKGGPKKEDVKEQEHSVGDKKAGGILVSEST